MVVINFSAQSAMELYERYMLNMGMPKEELAGSHTSDEVSNIMGELVNQIVGDFTGKVRRELQTHITQNQPKMLVLNKQVMLSVDTHLDKPEVRRVTFYTCLLYTSMCIRDRCGVLRRRSGRERLISHVCIIG